eukprot:6846173-Alexandrium_andersonii.AAC.1
MGLSGAAGARPHGPLHRGRRLELAGGGARLRAPGGHRRVEGGHAWGPHALGRAALHRLRA